MERSKQLLDVFHDYLSTNTYYEIHWSRLHQQYFSISVEDEPVIFLEDHNELMRHIVEEFLHDVMFSDEFSGEYKEDSVSEKVIEAFKDRMKPYIEKIPELEEVMNDTIKSECRH